MLFALLRYVTEILPSFSCSFFRNALQAGLDEDDAARLIEERGGGRSTMHVQSISHWAPANIGPYSQAVKVMERPTFAATAAEGRARSLARERFAHIIREGDRNS